MSPSRRDGRRRRKRQREFKRRHVSGLPWCSPRPSGIAKIDLPDLFGGLDREWPDGVPIKVILRGRAGTENGYLSKFVPALGPVLEAAYKRPGMPVGITDQHNADLATRTVGSLAIITLLQIRSERLNLRVLPLDGNVATPETLENDYGQG